MTSPQEAATTIERPVSPLSVLPYGGAPPIPSSGMSALRKPERVNSLDVFRGITIAAMLLVNNPGKGTAYGPLEHADWHGWTPTDLIFPFFLFIVGVAIPFSMAKRSLGQSRGQMLGHIWTRALSLFMLGELLQGIPFTSMQAVPAGFTAIEIMRFVAAAFCLIGIVLLLVPWRSMKMAATMPIALFLGFYVLATLIFLINRNALNNGLPADFGFGNGLMRPEGLRIPGVLQRIGICYGVAATIALFFGWRMIVVSAIVLMTIYSALMLKAPFPNHETGSLTEKDNLSRRIDETLLIRYKLDDHGNRVMMDGKPKTIWNHAYGAYPDNEGVLSTLPAIGSVLLSILVGIWLRTWRTAAERCAGVLVFGLFTLLLGLFLDRALMPINKNIWTPSFTVFTAGMGMLGLGVCFFFVDVLGRRRWSLPFTIYGMNAIAAFVIGGLVTRLFYVIKIGEPGQQVNLYAFLKDHAAQGVHNLGTTIGPWIDTQANTSLAYSLGYVILILVLMSALYFLRIFIKV